MTTLSQPTSIAHVQDLLDEVLSKVPRELGRVLGFIQRERELDGADFVRLCVLGWLDNPDAGVGDLARFGSDLDIHITGPGIHQRFTPQAADLLAAVWEGAISHVVCADPVALPLLRRFEAVVLEDSTIIRLPDELASRFRGCGARKGIVGLESSCKLQVQLDMLSGCLRCAALRDGREADVDTPLQAQPLAAHTLFIRDRGYLDLERWLHDAEQDRDTLSYYRADVTLAEPGGEPLDLLLLLAQMSEGCDREVLVGSKQLPMRLLACRVPPDVAAARRAYLRREAASHDRAVSHVLDVLAGYSVVLTTLSPQDLSLQEALVLLRLRWQIELLFKLWKQHGSLERSRSRNPWRILCELYAKLLAMLLQHWLLVVGCWHDPHRSLVKAAQVVRKRVQLLVLALTGDLSWQRALERILRAMQHECHLDRRRTAPNTSQQLLEGLTWPPLRQRKRKRH